MGDHDGPISVPSLYGELPALTATEQKQRNDGVSWVAYASVLMVGLMVAAVGYKRSYQPYIGVAIAFFVVLLACWVKFPRLALAGTIAFTLISDIVTVSWFPFTKNLSSPESITFLTDSLSLSPFELTVIWALIVTGFRNHEAGGRPFRSTPLSRPMMVFAFFVAVGLITGMSRGGDSRAAIFEVRPLIYFVLFTVLVVNVCSNRRDYQLMLYAALGAIFVQGLLSLKFYLALPGVVRQDLEALNEHGSAISMNLLFAMLFAALAFRGVSKRTRWTLLLLSLPLVYVYFVSQRRAAVVALGVALILIGIMLFMRQRRTFWKVVPLVGVIALGYIGAFWNSESTVGFPAQAVKSVLAPDQLSAADQSSDEYRQIERYNLTYTIRADPLRGQGFGQPFLRPVPLPDISRFEFNAYLPHNSLLWIWIKTGFFGFVTMMYIFARTVISGAARFRAAPPGIESVIAASGVIFVAMFATFLFVDIAWEVRNVVLLAVAMGLCVGPLADDPDEASSDQRVGSLRAVSSGVS